MYKLCVYEKSAPKCSANTDGSHSLKLRKTLKVTARGKCRQGEAQEGNCSWSIPKDAPQPDLEGATAFLSLPLGTPWGLGPTGNTDLFHQTVPPWISQRFCFCYGINLNPSWASVPSVQNISATNDVLQLNFSQGGIVCTKGSSN